MTKQRVLPASRSVVPAGSNHRIVVSCWRRPEAAWQGAKLTTPAMQRRPTSSTCAVCQSSSLLVSDQCQFLTTP